MKKRALLITLMFLIGIVGFIVARPSYDSSNNLLTINIEKEGWYLVPFGIEFGECGSNTIIKAVWIWSPILNKYIGGDITKLDSDLDNIIKNDRSNNYLYAFEKFGGMWIYSAGGSCELRDYYATVTDNELDQAIKQLKLAKGWNFINLIPPYKGKSIDEIKGNCNIVKMAEWNEDSQEWVISGGEEIDDNPIKNIGKVLLIKVEEECHLGLKVTEEISEPPPIIPS